MGASLHVRGPGAAFQGTAFRNTAGGAAAPMASSGGRSAHVPSRTQRGKETEVTVPGAPSAAPAHTLSALSALSVGRALQTHLCGPVLIDGARPVT